MHFFMSYKRYQDEINHNVQKSKNTNFSAWIVIVLRVGIAMPFVLTYIETGSADTYETAVPHRVNCASGILYGCSNGQPRSGQYRQ